MLTLLLSLLLAALMFASGERCASCPPTVIRDAHHGPGLPAPRAKGRHCTSLRRRKP